MPVIDLESFGTLVREIEEVFDRNDCNQADKQYVLQQMQARINQELQRQRTQDLMGQINPKEMIKKIMGKEKE